MFFCPAHHKPRGICLWFTGLCKAGKNSIARELLSHQKLARRAVLLDGDHFRALVGTRLAIRAGELVKKFEKTFP
jgi:adenylylsulfate kinase-like enzyme